MPFFGSFGATEMIFVMLVLLLVFGAKRLPELGSGLGKGIREFKRSMTDLGREIDRAGEDQPKEIRGAQRPTVAPPTAEGTDPESN